jgi:hypothetical protein
MYFNSLSQQIQIFLPFDLVRISAFSSDAPDEIDDISAILSKNPDPVTVEELKYKIGYVRMNSVDLVSTMSTLLSKIITEFDQPSLQAHSFVRAKGDAIVSVVLPIVRLMRKLLTEVIQVRNTSMALAIFLSPFVVQYGCHLHLCNVFTIHIYRLSRHDSCATLTSSLQSLSRLPTIIRLTGKWAEDKAAHCGSTSGLHDTRNEARGRV